MDQVESLIPPEANATAASQRHLLLAYDAYLAALRQIDRRIADQFVRSPRPLIEAMAVASDHMSALPKVARHAGQAVV
jgi:hypothetical protein